MPFPGGLKSYLDNPAAILQFRPTTCLKCNHDGRWHCHGKRPRYSSLDGRCLLTVVFRVRCPGCWTTTTLLPDGILPRLQHSLETVGRAVAGYLTTVQSYRYLSLSLNGTHLAPGERLSTCWGSPSAPAPGPSTICRWVARFSQGAGPWWDVLVDPGPVTPPTGRPDRTAAPRRQGAYPYQSQAVGTGVVPVVVIAVAVDDPGHAYRALATSPTSCTTTPVIPRSYRLVQAHPGRAALARCGSGPGQHQCGNSAPSVGFARLGSKEIPR